MKKVIKIGNNLIQESGKNFIIAEIGVNHNGSLDLAMKMIDAACEAGADCVKFQTFTAETLVTKSAPKAMYQLKVTDDKESQYDMLKSLELSLEQYEKIITYCHQKKINFLSTPYSVEDIDFLDRLGVPAFKVASGQIVERPFLSYMASKNKPIIASTGMANLSDVDAAVRTFRDTGNEDFVILQCTTNYPSTIADSNIKAMCTMEKAFNCLVGYSDHTENEISILAAVAMGSVVIEKHFTLDKSLKGPDHLCSADPAEFKALVEKIRMIETALGSGLKQPSKAEIANAKGMKRSMVAKCEISQGSILEEGMIAYKRPGTGLSPNMSDLVIGKKLNRSIEKDEMLSLNMFDWNS